MEPRKPLGLFKNAMKHKHSFIQLFAMTGILMLSMRSLGQKYRIHDLEEDNRALREEQNSISDRMANIKRDLLHEASLDPTGLFASKISSGRSQDLKRVSCISLSITDIPPCLS